MKPEQQAKRPALTAKRPEPKANYELRLIGLGDLSPREHPLGASHISVGSDRENDLVIAHSTVSRKHAILRQDAGRYTIADLESTNGTFVNGRRLKQPVLIKPGDEISFGAAKFAMMGGAGVARRMRHRRSPSRMIGAVAGIVLFAIAGFLGARYALYLSRSATQTAQGPRDEKVSAARPVIPLGEATASAAQPSIASAAPDAADDPSPIWLKHLNDFRDSVNLAPVGSDPKLSDGDRNHAIYVLKNFASEIRSGELGAQVHTEDTARPWYTPEGAEAARTSDVAEQGASAGRKVPDPQGWAIDGWMIAPFHRLFILSPLLHDAGFGYDCEDSSCVALLNVLSGADPLPRIGTPLEHPILFPPDGASIPPNMGALDTEWPTPISGCDGYAFPTGLPLTVQLGPMVDAQLNSFSLARDDGATLEACGFDANSYRNPDESERTRVVSNLRGQGAIVIVPRGPLEAGARYDVVATVNGRDYKWSFAIGR
jgi:uncharacterized protein YkwD